MKKYTWADWLETFDDGNLDELEMMTLRNAFEENSQVISTDILNAFKERRRLAGLIGVDDQ